MFKPLYFLLKFIKRHWLYGLVCISVALCLYLFTPQPSHGSYFRDLLRNGAQIIQLSNISNAQEVELGRQINQQLISQKKIKINSDRRLNRYVNRIGQQLAINSYRPNIPYTFQVVNDDNINAFATMGGFVYVNSGLMKAADNEAELASVIAHEIGHIAGGHALQQMRQKAINQGILSAVGLRSDKFIQIGVELAINLPNSREDEFDADHMGLMTLERSGYAPLGMLTFMRKLKQYNGDRRNNPSFLNTHPATSERISFLRRRIDPQTSDLGRGLNDTAYQNLIDRLL